MDPLFEFALAVKAITRELDKQAGEAMRPLGLTAPQADAIAAIGQAGALSLKELGSLVIAEAGHPSRLVDRLVEGGFVERRPAGDDRRRVVLTLTARGRRLEKRVVAARRQIFELAREVVGDRDLEPALELLRDLIQFTRYADLIDRRRELLARNPAAPEAGSRTLR